MNRSKIALLLLVALVLILVFISWARRVSLLKSGVTVSSPTNESISLLDIFNNPQKYKGHCFKKQILITELSCLLEGKSYGGDPMRLHLTFKEILSTDNNNLPSTIRMSLDVTHEDFCKKLGLEQSYRVLICSAEAFPIEKQEGFVCPIDGQALKEGRRDKHNNIKYLCPNDQIYWFYDLSTKDWSKVAGSRGPMSSVTNQIISTDIRTATMVLLRFLDN